MVDVIMLRPIFKGDSCLKKESCCQPRIILIGILFIFKE